MYAYEESLPLSRVDYTLTVGVTDDGEVIQDYPPMDIHLDDMEPVLPPDAIVALTASLPDNEREIMGVVYSVMTLDEIEEWGRMGTRAASESRRIQGKQPIEITDSVAIAIMEKCIVYEAYTEDMPDNPARRFDAARSMLMLLIEAIVRDGVATDHPDPDVAQMGEAIEEILALAGIYPGHHDLNRATDDLMTMRMP